MRQRTWRLMRELLTAAVLVTGLLRPQSTGDAAELVLKDGRILTGQLGETARVADVPKPANVGVADMARPILVVNDGLRRIFVPQRHMQDVRPEEGGDFYERFEIRQRIIPKAQVTSVGPIVKVTDFDKYGHRTFIMQTPTGNLAVVQGITEITPLWTKVEGLDYAKYDPRNYYTDAEYNEKTEILRKERIDWLAQFPGLAPEIAKAVEK